MRLEAVKSLVHVGLLRERFTNAFWLLLLANAVGDVPDVAEGAGNVSVLDRAVEVFFLAAADGVDEVVEVFSCAAGFKLADALVIVIVGPPPAGLTTGEVAVFAVDDVSAANAFVMGSRFLLRQPRLKPLLLLNGDADF